VAIGASTPSPTPIPVREGFITERIRALIAEYLHVAVEKVTDEAQFANDLGADWLDHLDLMIAIEDQFAGVQFGDEDLARMVTVGDLFRYIEGWSIEALSSVACSSGHAPGVRPHFGAD
jgi:acyl carrier protein